MTAKLSDSMIATILEALIRPSRTEDGTTVYQVQGNAGTLKALTARGKVENVARTIITPGINDGCPHWATATWLTADCVAWLREALEYVLNTRTDEGRDPAYQGFIAASRRNSEAVAAFLLGYLRSDTTEVKTLSTALGSRPYRETLTGEAAIEQLGNILSNGQRITFADDGKIMAQFKTGSTTFTPDRPAVEEQHDRPAEQQAPVAVVTVEDVDHHMYVGILREEAKDMGTVGPDNVRAAITSSNTDGWPVERFEDGTIKVGYSFFEPIRPAAAPAPRPATEVLAADPIPADTSVLNGMPGKPVGRDGMPARNAVTHTDYVTQLRSGGTWVLPNHDDQADITGAQVISAMASVRQYAPDHTRASIDTDGTIYLSNGRLAARYIPAALIEGYSTTVCPGCDTSYAVNGDGPCTGGRSTPAPDYAQAAAELLGEMDTTTYAVRFVNTDSVLRDLPTASKEEAADMLASVLRMDGKARWTSATELVTSFGDAVLTITAPEAPADDDESAEEAVNLNARFIPQAPNDAEGDTRPCLEVGSAQVYAYYLDGVLQIGIEASGDEKIPMLITVGGNTVFTA
ncbi:hypothetical protein E6R60_26605 [Streptomyces sp. A0642]|uniref:hypothetical protein n=1 Tax=Streptomyces sp. A0642 TaxID=2563100 RepID=UPI0010A244F5|nr:hypothetical protein [Streptomyces sp. A0642]THA72504.1 hypothetical protein E6R60_26605 [Streptomyces sp. A0642]